MQGAFWALMAGFAAGILRFGLQFGFSSPGCGSGEPGIVLFCGTLLLYRFSVHRPAARNRGRSCGQVPLSPLRGFLLPVLGAGA